jgi:hypothetical protein
MADKMLEELGQDIVRSHLPNLSSLPQAQQEFYLKWSVKKEFEDRTQAISNRMAVDKRNAAIQNLASGSAADADSDSDTNLPATRKRLRFSEM